MVRACFSSTHRLVARQGVTRILVNGSKAKPLAPTRAESSDPPRTACGYLSKGTNGGKVMRRPKSIHLNLLSTFT